jgi:oligopeptide transport system ATP-binding protein
MSLLEVRDLTKLYPLRTHLLGGSTKMVRAVDGVSFDLKAGEAFGLVGESGCGKTTTGRCVLRLIEPTSGQIRYENEDLLKVQPGQMRRLRKNMQMIFQDPYASLNPRMTIGAIMEEPLIIHQIGNRQQRNERVHQLLNMVGLDPAFSKRYPHEFSGGQRQRIGIARALALEPKLIIADEPVSALDVSVQAQIINLLKDLQQKLHLTFLFIAHDLSIVQHFCDRIAVMYLGKIVELASSHELFSNPMHPYTKVLLDSVPIPDPEARHKRQMLTGDVPTPIDPPSGCRFHTRCSIAEEKCKEEEPQLNERRPEHWVSCHLA